MLHNNVFYDDAAVIHIPHLQEIQIHSNHERLKVEAGGTIQYIVS